MKMIEVTMVRIYLNEKEAHLESLLQRLHDWEKVRGVRACPAKRFGHGVSWHQRLWRLGRAAYHLVCRSQF